MAQKGNSNSTQNLSFLAGCVVYFARARNRKTLSHFFDMSVLLRLIRLAATFGIIRADDNASKELGKGIDLRKTNLLGDFQERQASVFASLPSDYFIKKTLHYSDSNFDYFPSTKQFYQKMAIGAGLDASLESAFTLGATLSSLIQKADSNETQVSGMSDLHFVQTIS